MALAAQVLADTRQMSRDQWLSLRRSGLGGSDAAAAVGLNPWKSPLSLFMEKRGETPDIEPNESMYWGTRLEDIVAEEFTVRTSIKTRRRNAVLRHPEHPYLLANVDRLIVGADEGLEVKTASEYARESWDSEEIPAQYLIQCQHYMAVTGYQAWWIAVLIGGNKFQCKRIERDDELIHSLVAAESEFWMGVETGRAPLPDGSESTSELIKAMYPSSAPGQSMDLPDEATNWIVQHEEATKLEKQAKERKEEAANRIKLLMQDAEIAFCGDKKVSWKSITVDRLDTKALKSDLPDLAQRYLKTSQERRFSIK